MISIVAVIVLVNSWFMDHIVGVVNDPTYPNSTFNPGLVASNLTEEDWYLLESYPCNTGSFYRYGVFQMGYPKGK